MNISDTNTVIASTAPLHPQKISEQSHPSTNQKGGVSNDGGLGKTADVAPSSERILYNKIEGVNAQAHTMVTQIREVDDTMDAVSKNVQQMKVALDHIVKSYPPYPKGSNERIHALRQFGGLRKLIDQLTVPPPDDGPGKVIGNAQTHPEVGRWEIKVSDSHESIAIGRHPIHAGTGGLNLPDLPMDADDGALNDALSRVEKAQQTLQARRRGFVTDANRVIATIS